MTHHGFLRVAAAAPSLRVADCAYNAEHILALMDRAEAEAVSVLVFPELCLTGYTCADLFHQVPLQKAALEALLQVVSQGVSRFSGLAVVGLPLAVEDQLFNCAAVFHEGEILGVVPKSFIPNYKEFYELRWFAPGAGVAGNSIELGNDSIPFGTDLLIEADNVEGLLVGVEICEDLWVPIPPSCYQALRGHAIIEPVGQQ